MGGEGTGSSDAAIEVMSRSIRWSCGMARSITAPPRDRELWRPIFLEESRFAIYRALYLSKLAARCCSAASFQTTIYAARHALLLPARAVKRGYEERRASTTCSRCVSRSLARYCPDCCTASCIAAKILCLSLALSSSSAVPPVMGVGRSPKTPFEG